MLEEKKFQRTVEDFICANCGAEIKGDGYTDHCPVCLWGKHVDINPGDRAANCAGLMEPIGIEEKKGRFRIRYRCQRCDYQFTVKAAENDDINEIIRLSTKS